MQISADSTETSISLSIASRVCKSRSIRLLITAVVAVACLSPVLYKYYPQIMETLSGKSATYIEVRLAGITSPELHPASKVQLAPNAEVVGITVDGEPRAYLVSAMAFHTDHVVNDRVQNRPISVTYCNIHDCVKVFDGSRATDAMYLNLGTAGFDDSSMILHLGEHRYTQDSQQPLGNSPEFPFREHEFVRTTWHDWQELHPDTSVYVGRN